VRLCTGPSSATLARRILRDGPPRNDEHTVCQRFEAEGAKGLINKRPGRKPGEQRLLTPAQEAEIQALICHHTPDELGLPFALWSRAAVGMLIARHCGVELAVRTVGKYLARWGFTAQKPIRRAYEQDPAAVRRWLRQDYPEIVKRAKQARGVVVWGDETGLRSDDVRGRSYAPRGRTPVVRVCHKRAGLSLITAVTNRGKLRWMIVDGAVNAPTFIRFLERLIREARCKVFLILDRLKVHRARLTRDWLAEHSSEIEVFYLPAYSPDLNPDEGVHADLKQALPRKAPARSKQQLKRAAVSHMRSLSKRPQRIRAIFRHPQFRYASCSR
jgi:transposase